MTNINTTFHLNIHSLFDLLYWLMAFQAPVTLSYSCDFHILKVQTFHTVNIYLLYLKQIENLSFDWHDIYVHASCFVLHWSSSSACRYVEQSEIFFTCLTLRVSEHMGHTVSVSSNLDTQTVQSRLVNVNKISDYSANTGIIRHSIEYTFAFWLRVRWEHWYVIDDR